MKFFKSAISALSLTQTVMGARDGIPSETRDLYHHAISTGKGVAGLTDHAAKIASKYTMEEAIERINDPKLSALIQAYGIDKAVYEKAMSMILKMMKEVLDGVDKKVLTDCKPRIEFLKDLIDSTSSDLTRVNEKKSEGLTGFLEASDEEEELEGQIRQKESSMSELKQSCDEEITHLKADVKEKHITFQAVEALKKAAFPPKTMFTQLSKDGQTIRHLACVSRNDNGDINSVLLADPHKDVHLKNLSPKLRQEVLMAMSGEQVPGGAGTINCPTEMTSEGLSILADKMEDLYNKHSDEYDDAREALGNYQLSCIEQQKALRAELNNVIRQKQSAVIRKTTWEKQKDVFTAESHRVEGLLLSLEEEKSTLQDECTTYVNKKLEDEYCPLLATRNNLVERQEGQDAAEKIDDCVVTDWVEESCSIDCISGVTNHDLATGAAKGNGIQTLTRAIEQAPSKNGVACGALSTTVPCNNIPCPRDCVAEEWQDNWSECTSTCGPATKTRTRGVISHASNNGADCDSLVETVSCPTPPCGRHCELGTWNAWTLCSAACSDHGIPGRQVRTRNIREGYGEGYVRCPEEMSNLRTNLQTCNVNKVCDPNAYLQCKSRARVVLFLDISGSMWSIQTLAVKQTLLALTHRFAYGKYTDSNGVLVNENPVEMTYYLYNHRIKTIDNKEPQFHQDMAKVRALIEKTPRPGGGTATHKAVLKCINRLGTKQPDVDNVCLVVTDGWTPRRPLKMAIEKAARVGVRIILVEVTGGARLVQYLQKFVTYPAASNMITVKLRQSWKYDPIKRRWSRPTETLEKAKQYGWTLSYHIAHMMCPDTTAAV